MPTYKIVHSEYFCATKIVLRQVIIRGRHVLQASTLHSPRRDNPCLRPTKTSTEQLRAFTPLQVSRPGRKLGGFDRHLLTRSDQSMLFVLANGNVCHSIILLSVRKSVYYQNSRSSQLRNPVGEKGNYYKTPPNFSVSH